MLLEHLRDIGPGTPCDTTVAAQISCAGTPVLGQTPYQPRLLRPSENTRVGNNNDVANQVLCFSLKCRWHVFLDERGVSMQPSEAHAARVARVHPARGRAQQPNEVFTLGERGEGRVQIEAARAAVVREPAPTVQFKSYE